MGYYHYPVFHYMAACSFLSLFLFLIRALFHTHSLLLLIFFLLFSVFFPSLCLFSCAPFPSLSLSSCIPFPLSFSVFLLQFFFFCLIFFLFSSCNIPTYSLEVNSLAPVIRFVRFLDIAAPVVELQEYPSGLDYKSSSNKSIDNTRTADT